MLKFTPKQETKQEAGSPGETRQTRRHPNKKLYPGFEKYISSYPADHGWKIISILVGNLWNSLQGW